MKDYKTSLNSLSALYQNEVQRLEQKNQQAKELFKDGLISRVDMEASDKALADAQAKVEEIAKQMMQLMPGTAARYGVANPSDIAQSIQGGTRYLKDLLKMFNGRIDQALAGYNAGENAVIKYGYTIPPYEETRNYVKLIIKRYGAVGSRQNAVAVGSKRFVKSESKITSEKQTTWSAFLA